MTLCGSGVSAVHCGARSGNRRPTPLDGCALRRGGLEDGEIEISEQTRHGMCQTEVVPARVDVLQFVDQDVAVRVSVSSRLNEIGGAVDHVVEVDLSGPGKPVLVELEDRAEDGWERVRAHWVAQDGDAPGELVEGAAGTLEVLEGGRKQASKLLAASPLLEGREHFLPRL